MGPVAGASARSSEARPSVIVIWPSTPPDPASIRPAAGQRQRPVELDGPVAKLPAQRDRSTEQLGRGREVAGGDRRSDLGAAHDPPIERERRHDDDVEATLAPQLRERIRRPAPLEAERCVRGHEQSCQ